MADPTSKLRFRGDEKDLTRSLDRVQGKMSDTARGITREAGKAEQALKGVQTAADRIKDRRVAITAEARADMSRAEADIKGLRGHPVEVPVKAETAAAEKKIKGMGKDAGAQAGSDAGSAFGGKFLGVLGGVGFASTLAGIASDAFSKAADKAKVTANLQNQMGVSPAEARMYGDRVGAAYATGLGESKDQIASVYSTLSSDVRDWSSRTMDAQDSVAKRQVKVVQGLGIDTVAAVGAASSAVTNKLVPSFESAQDLLVTGFQILGSRGADWADSLKEYSGYFYNLGFDGAAALGTINQMIKAGARDTDYAADAWKEFNIRIIDGSENTKSALKMLGPEFAKLPQEIAKGGPAAFAATDKIVDKLREIKDPIKQAEIGVLLFGSQWEDTMRQVITSVDLSSAAMSGKFEGAVDKMAVATDTNMDRFQRRWENGLSIVGEKMASWANDGAALIDGFTDHVVGKLEKDVGPLNPFKGMTEAMQKLNKMTVDVKVQAEWQKVQDIHNRLMKLPPKTPVVVDALTANATSDLERLGYKVRTLPGGKVEVYADTRPATDQAARTVAWLNSLYANITVGVVGPGKNYALKNTKGGMAAFAKGGVVQGPRGVDRVPVWATAGEHITQEQYARRPDNARVLENINSGRPWNAGMAMVPSGSASSPGGLGAGGSGGGRAPGVYFSGNTDTALATVVMKLWRDGKIKFS